MGFQMFSKHGGKLVQTAMELKGYKYKETLLDDSERVCGIRSRTFGAEFPSIHCDF